ncbi:AAA ATPase central domain protein [Methanohalobium evestigatum Z-7303]|uniref:AAA ATPase central domain protein n=1 Tax=Methanohalobium evestigatum (strain ATCC BAA-1072 / DSM 3721 / NBRC 107634 / OCM 161 / Z-7303) TaxID=644295 RepID=D7EA09_METEZ|nr:ATP-binding protein [Methanohalobium evestigatum]ADI74680.1 AAA ATPase central domain protein [Methanohalobium evestigatum Z-7303]
MSGETLDIVELLLTAEVYNKYSEMDVNDLPKQIRKNYWDREKKTVPKPINVSVSDIKNIYEIEDIKSAIKSLPFVDIDELQFTVKLTAFDMGADWFKKQDGAMDRIGNNPALSFYFEKKETEGVSYESTRSKSAPKEVDREWVDSLITEIEQEEGGEDMLKLAHIEAPEDIMQTFEDIVLTDEQEDEVEKIVKAIQYREHLKTIGMYDIGKLLLIGAPGTGKTSVARAVSHRLSLPFVEVRLSMVTDQYLGETAKNIDRVFTLAKRLNPCVLFIDEFDFVAKKRTSDESAALKRAVNTLLKAIDEVSLTNDGVLLIAATNHPNMLDTAAWRRFDEVMNFPLPDMEMRKMILDRVTSDIDGDLDTEEIAQITEGYAGSDLRMVIREGVLSALMEDRKALTQDDLKKAVENFNQREIVKSDEYA